MKTAMVLRRSKTLGLVALVVLLAIGVIALWALSVPAPVESWLRVRVLSALKEHYGREVRLQNLRVTLIPVFRVTADNFVLPSLGPTDLPPFVMVKHITAEAFPLQLLRRPFHLSWAKLDGLVINVPPKQSTPPGQSPGPEHRERLADFEIDRLDADGTKLYVLPKQAGREPMEWELHSLTLHSAGIGQPMRFLAELTNPKPPGLIHTSGKFGPWNLDSPSETPVSGHYTFRNADLSVFNGIAGILSSTGDFTGMLQEIVVDGTTETPDFKLDSGAGAVHLSTQFHAIVDGMNGNTYLQPVSARFLNSNVVARGEVAGKPREKGKTIALDVNIGDATVQDMFNLAVEGPRPLVTGALSAHAKLVIPPGKQTVLNRIQLSGTFRTQDLRFTDDKVKDTVDALSRRAQGKPDDQTIQDVRARLVGTFDLRNATLSFARLQFEVPGATAAVKGSYGLHDGQINFTGDVKLQAQVSQTMTGAKRVLLKPVDPLFARHHAGTYLPVNITGQKDKPQIKLDLKKVF